MTLAEADTCAAHLLQLLRPHCERIEVGGSVRRRKPEPKDIELVCIPKQEALDLLGEELVNSQGFVTAVMKAGVILKGSLPVAKYIQLQLPLCKVDLFCCDARNWGYIFFLRTGPGDWNIRAVQRLKERGYRPKDGQVWHKGVPVDLPEEDGMWPLLGCAPVAPERRR